MSTGRSNATDALPRGSFLTYFRSPQSPRSPNSPKRSPTENVQKGSLPTRPQCSQAPPLPRIPEDAPANHSEEELRLEDHEHPGNGEDEEEEHGWGWTEIITFIGYMLLVLLIVLNLNLLLSAYNSDPGLLRWEGRDNNGGAGLDMRFCLADQDRLAPTSRVWRYVPRNSQLPCTTRILTIHASPSEENKLFTQDIISGEALEKGTCDPSKGDSKRESEKGGVLEGGDDLAQEGILSQEVYTR